MIIKTQAGNFKGVEHPDYIEFLGIRYASSSRFGRPKGHIYNKDVIYNCNTPAPLCIQSISSAEKSISKIDTLNTKQTDSPQFLSLTIPKTHTMSQKPVMVYIHGGSYVNGGIDYPTHSRHHIVAENNVILVSIGYRLGILGFTRDEEGNFANNGILDIIAGLKWVKQNISAFGGDSNNITIFGQSAGADATKCVMLASGTENLYNKAIIQSAPIGLIHNRGDIDSRILQKVNQIPLNCSINELQEYQNQILEDNYGKIPMKYLKFVPHFGVFPLPKESEIEQRLIQIAPTHPLFIGCTTREASLFMSNAQILQNLQKFGGTRWLVESIIHKVSSKIFIKPSQKLAKMYANSGGTTYFYKFCWAENNSPTRACHCTDLLLLFGGEEFVDTPIAMGLSRDEIIPKGKAIRNLWANFAKTSKITQSIPNQIIIKNLSQNMIHNQERAT